VTIERTELLDLLKSVPDKPGVYLWKDDAGEILYVGKANELRKRMRQYVSGHDDRARIPMMMSRVASFDYIVTRNESEALILELNLINQHTPPFNVDYRDDKSYPFIAITMADTFPAIKYTREKPIKGTRYFGPYTDARAARSVIESIRRLMPMCRASCPEWKQIAREQKKGRPFKPTRRPCFDSHIGLGPGVCEGTVDPDEYREKIDTIVHFLTGRSAPLEHALETMMYEAAAELDFEGAARFKNRIHAFEALKDRQTVVADADLDLDVIGTYREETISGVYLFVVRGGKVLFGNEFVLDKGLDVPYDDLLSGFLTKYYAHTAEIPPAIAVEREFEDLDVIEQWLTTMRPSRSAKVRIVVPQRGVKRDLVEMATRNARHALVRWILRTHYEDERLNEALLQLESALALSTSPVRIECYDISTLHGTNSVGSLVVFTGGKKDAKGYRRFRVRLETDESNDVAMMREVLGRRFSERNKEDIRFASAPDLIVVDGGKPQLNAAKTVLDELGVDVDVVGLAKREEEVFTTWSDAPVILPDGSPSLYLMKRIRDEAHRFAVEYHRLLRSKAMTASILDEIVGIGPKKRKALIKHFGSFKRLKEATVVEIAQVPGINEALALDVYSLIHLGDAR
jgi:excinuclease ABC subunit C